MIIRDQRTLEALLADCEAALAAERAAHERTVSIAEAALTVAVAAFQPLVEIANAYDANELDDEARKFWGDRGQFENDTPSKEVILYSGRGGKTLLTLAHCLAARRLL